MDANFADVSPLADLEQPVASGRSLSRAEAERVAECRDLPSVGMLGELARKARHGNRVTFVRVCEVGRPPLPRNGGEGWGEGDIELGEAGEVRLIGAPESLDQARSRVRDAARFAGGAALTGFSLADLWRLAGGETAALADLAAALRHDGMESIAEVALDEVGGKREAIEALRVLAGAGLGAWRATVTRAAFTDRLDLIDLAASLQRETASFKAFAPLPRVDPGEQPSTGYDDVRTIALARLFCGDIPSIQVDWALHGPKLAQVALAYGADDLDNVPATSSPDLGRRRSTREEIERHIRMAFAEPVERDGRYAPRS